MKNTNLIIVSIVMLVAGLALGYSVREYPSSGKPMMSSGQMMGNMQMGGMGGAMSDMMSGLSGKTGDDFDRAFLSEMIVHHQGAVQMAQEVLKKSKRPELIQLAKDIISAQTREINMMNEWQKEWFNQ